MVATCPIPPTRWDVFYRYFMTRNKSLLSVAPCREFVQQPVRLQDLWECIRAFLIIKNVAQLHVEVLVLTFDHYITRGPKILRNSCLGVLGRSLIMTIWNHRYLSIPKKRREAFEHWSSDASLIFFVRNSTKVCRNENTGKLKISWLNQTRFSRISRYFLHATHAFVEVVIVQMSFIFAAGAKAFKISSECPPHCNLKNELVPRKTCTDKAYCCGTEHELYCCLAYYNVISSTLYNSLKTLTSARQCYTRYGPLNAGPSLSSSKLLLLFLGLGRLCTPAGSLAWTDLSMDRPFLPCVPDFWPITPNFCRPSPLRRKLRCSQMPRPSSILSAPPCP